MNVSEFIKKKINRLPKSYIFTSSDFSQEVENKSAVVKALNRMVQNGELRKISQGLFFKPEMSMFGELQPPQEQIVKDLLISNGKLVGYLTGYSIYSKLGLTTQVSNTIQIGKNDVRGLFKRGQYTISFIKQKNTITSKNIPLLQILDSIRYIKNIPDTTIQKACKRFMVILSALKEDEMKRLVRLSLKYPPSTRALLGCLLEEMGICCFSEELKKSLNSITEYKLFGSEVKLINADNWNIV